ncbi:MAG: tetratricopeptide repeat protein, partial [Anaerolineae bacterium]
GEGTVPFLLSDRQTIQINPAGEVRLDVARFRELIAGAPTPAGLEEAVALYRGDFLCDFYLTDSEAFEDWAAARRAEFSRQSLDALEALTDHHIQHGEYDQAQTYAWRQLALDDLREPAYRQLMTALALDGQRGAALAQYQLCRKRLGRELGAEPSAETTALYEQIQADALCESLARGPQPAPARRGMPVFLFTDIQGSTPLWETHREAMLPALLAHNQILEERITSHGGRILELRGDGVKAVFEGVDPLPCVLAIQKAFGQQDWGPVGEIRVRIGLHGVPPEGEGHEYFLRGDQYYGPALHHAARVMDAGHGGQILVSEQVRNSFPLPPGAAWQDFGLHRLRGIEEPQRIFGLLHPDLPRQEFPPLRTPTMEVERPEPLTEVLPVERPTPRHNLPAQATPFIGREDELAHLNRLISDPDARLITIVGPGGIGKTRLALAAAERQLDATRTTDAGPEPRFPDGVHFVPLAALSSADQIVPTVAEALTFQLRAGEDEARTPKQQILAYLRQKRSLLILDNFEHLLDGTHPENGAKLLSDVMQTAPDVQILVTSRERVHLHEEQVYAIQGLEFPDWETPTAAPAAPDVTKYTAAQLFLQTARRERHDFELGPGDPPALAHICRLVAGTPLAIELAASWVDALSLADIAAEIQRSLDFLEAEWRDVPQRHRSMRAAFDTSWGRLGAAEQDAFSRLSVFRGGFSRAAAREVTGASLRTLATLVNKSLLQYDRGQDRYDIHELLRQYGAEKLIEDPGKETAVRDRHSAYYCAALQEWDARLKGPRHYATPIYHHVIGTQMRLREARLRGPRHSDTLSEMEADIENARAAWEWAAVHGQVARLDQAVDGLILFYELRSRIQEAELACRLAADALSQMGPAPSIPGDSARVLAKIQIYQADFSVSLGHRARAESLLRQSQELLDSPALGEQDTRAERALLLRTMGTVAHPNYDEALRLFEQSLALYRVGDDLFQIAHALRLVGLLAVALRDYDRARQMYEESLAVYQTLDHQLGTVAVRNQLGMMAREAGDHDEAKRLFEEGLASSQAQGNQWGVALSLEHLAWLALFQGRFEAAGDLLRRAVEIYQDTGDRLRLALALNALGQAHWLSGRFDQACASKEQALVILRDVAVDESIEMMARIGEVGVWAGRIEEARRLAQIVLAQAHDAFDPREVAARSHRVLGWAALAEENYGEAQRWLQKGAAAYRETAGEWGDEYLALTLVALGRAEYGLGDRTEAQAHLVEVLEIVLRIRAYIPLLFAMPIAPLLLVDTGEVERAVELYALAESHPFVANSRLFEDIAGRHIEAAAAALPPDVAEAAQARGGALDWWETAAELLEGLRQLGRGEPPSAPAVPSNLPPQPTPFIGREEELAELDDLIADPDLRLVTIAGPGGMGKTRLAIAAAERQLEATEDGAPRFPQGAFFVPLAALSSTEYIVPAVAEALSFPLRGEEGETRAPKEQVLDYLREKQLLLVMDNFEHLLDGADLVTDILQEAPDVQVLVTSRERLLLREEQMYPIRGLEFPDWETPEDAAEYTAARLFLQSARRVRPDFELVADDPTYLTRICRLVEGMPLAVELAAAWVDTLSLADIAAEIQRSLDFLETEWRDVPARHRSIRAVFDTSWQQMDQMEQAVFPQLSVFRGGFSREAAEQIGTTHDGSPASLRLLLRLTNKSLLQYDRTRDRYDIHELLRQCGAEKLAASPEAEAAVRDRHSAYFCAALQRWEADLKGSRTQEALDEIDADIDNMRAAWEWAARQGQVSQLDQAMDGLCLFYWQRYRPLEGIAACQLAAEVLAQADPTATAPDDSGRVLARGLAWQGFFYAWLGNKGLAEPLLRQSLDLLDSPALGDCDTRRERAFLLWAMGYAAMPDREQVRRVWERSASLYRALGDQWWAATVLGWWGRGITWFLGDPETAREKYEESLALFQSLGHRRGITEILLRLGELARETCDYDEAQRTFEEGLALSRAQGDLWSEALSLAEIGWLALFQGQFEDGLDSLQRAVKVRQQIGDRRKMAVDRSTCGTEH